MAVIISRLQYQTIFLCTHIVLRRSTEALPAVSRTRKRPCPLIFSASWRLVISIGISAFSVQAAKSADAVFSLTVFNHSRKNGDTVMALKCVLWPLVLASLFHLSEGIILGTVA